MKVWSSGKEHARRGGEPPGGDDPVESRNGHARVGGSRSATSRRIGSCHHGKGVRSCGLSCLKRICRPWLGSTGLFCSPRSVSRNTVFCAKGQVFWNTFSAPGRSTAICLSCGLLRWRRSSGGEEKAFSISTSAEGSRAKVLRRGISYSCFCAMRPGEMAESDYACGLLMTHIHRGPFPNHIVLILPSAEQQRIATVFDALMALCNRFEVSLSTVTTRRCLLDAFLAEALDPAAQTRHATE